MRFEHCYTERSRDSLKGTFRNAKAYRLTISWTCEKQHWQWCSWNSTNNINSCWHTCHIKIKISENQWHISSILVHTKEWMRYHSKTMQTKQNNKQLQFYQYNLNQRLCFSTTNGISKLKLCWWLMKPKRAQWEWWQNKIHQTFW